MKKFELPSSAASTPHPVALELPDRVFAGIGRVVSAQAVLEHEVLNLLIMLAEFNRPAGRITVREQAAADRFKTCHSMLVMHGVNLKGVKPLLEKIDRCSKSCDELARGVWLQSAEGGFYLMCGEYDEQGPRTIAVTDDHFERTRRNILATMTEIVAVRRKVEGILQEKLASAPAPRPAAAPGEKRKV